MSCSRRKTQDGARRKSPPLVVVLAVIVLVVLGAVVYWLAVHKSNPEQADEIVIASANAPAKAEAQPAAKPDKHEPQPGDVVRERVITVGEGDEKRWVGVFQVILVNKAEGTWEVSGRILIPPPPDSILTVDPQWVVHHPENPNPPVYKLFFNYRSGIAAGSVCFDDLPMTALGSDIKLRQVTEAILVRKN